MYVGGQIILIYTHIRNGKAVISAVHSITHPFVELGGRPFLSVLLYFILPVLSLAFNMRLHCLSNQKRRKDIRSVEKQMCDVWPNAKLAEFRPFYFKGLDKWRGER